MRAVHRNVWQLFVWLGLSSCDPSPFEDVGRTNSPPAEAGVDSGPAQETQRPGQDEQARDGGEPSQSGTAGRAGEAGRSGNDDGEDEAGSGAAGGQQGGQQGGKGAAGMQATAGASGSAGQPAEVCQRAEPDAAVSVIEVRDAGTLASPASLVLRIPGPISWLGGKLTWLFPKTIRDTGTVGADAAPNQPNAAFVNRDDPTKPEEDLDPDGVPRRFLTADDSRPATELWPSALLRVPPPADQETATGLAFVRTTSDLIHYDVAVGRVLRNTTTAQEPLTPLFTGDDPKFSTGGFRGAEYAYLFACDEDESVADRGDPKHYPCKLARAKLAELEQRDSYRVYDPAQGMWLADLSAGAPVLYGVPSMLSLSYNNYLGRYIAVHSRWFSNEIVVQTAPFPAGPWREELRLALPAPSVGVVQTALEQPALIAPDECARAIWVSYMSPTAESAGYPSEAEVKLVRVVLR